MARENERNDSLLNRRTYLKGVGTAAIAVASTGLSDSSATAKGPTHVLSIVADEGDAVDYKLTVTEWTRKSTSRYTNEELESRRRTVSGRVDGDTVSYEYFGEIRFLDVDGDATIYRDGTRISPSDVTDIPAHLAS